VSHKKILRLERKFNDYRFSKRSRILVLAKKNYPLCEIALITGISEDRIREWISRFNEFGYTGLLDLPRSGRPRKIPYEEIQRILNTAPSAFGINAELWSVATLHRVLSEKFTNSYTKKYLYQLIYRLEFSLKKPRPVHYKADPKAAREIKKKIQEMVDDGYVVFYEDETRVFLTTIVKRAIVRRGEKAVMRVNVEHHQGIFIFGALNVRTKEVNIMFSEKVDSKAAMKFLYTVKKDVGRGRVYVIWDNAGSHKAKRVKYLAERKGIHFVYLPPYSPYLNPVEEIWRQLKMYLANKLFMEISDVKREVTKFFEERGYRMEINVSHYFSE